MWASSHNFVVTTQASKDPNKLAASRAFISYISERSIEWAKSGQVPARNSVRESPEFAGADGAVDAGRPAAQRRLPAVGARASVTSPTPTYETAVNEVILGKKQTKAALDAAAKKADALLKANQPKYQA